MKPSHKKFTKELTALTNSDIRKLIAKGSRKFVLYISTVCLQIHNKVVRFTRTTREALDQFKDKIASLGDVALSYIDRRSIVRELTPGFVRLIARALRRYVTL